MAMEGAVQMALREPAAKTTSWLTAWAVWGGAGVSLSLAASGQ